MWMGDFMQDYPSKLTDHLAGAALQINIRTAAGWTCLQQGFTLNLSNGSIPSRYNPPAL
jgi:hypothetical protein